MMRSFSFGTRIGFSLTFLCSGEPGEPGEPETSRLEEESFRELLHIQHTLLGKKLLLIFLYTNIRLSNIMPSSLCLVHECLVRNA